MAESGFIGGAEYSGFRFITDIATDLHDLAAEFLVPLPFHYLKIPRRKRGEFKAKEWRQSIMGSPPLLDKTTAKIEALYCSLTF